MFCGCASVVKRNNIATTVGGEQVGLHADELTQPGSPTEEIKQPFEMNRWDETASVAKDQPVRLYSFFLIPKQAYRMLHGQIHEGDSESSEQ